MELQKEGGTSPGNLDNIITKFCGDLLAQLSINNGSLQKSCFENYQQIKHLRLEKLQLFQSICNLKKTYLNSNAYILVFHLASNSALWRHSLQFGLQKVNEGVARHNESCKEWKREAELKLQVAQDDFTMMPFHDVEMEINTINQEINSSRKKIQEIIEKSEIRNSALEVEFKELLLDIAAMEPYEKEIRKSKEQLNRDLLEIKRQQKFDAFHANSEAQKKLHIQKDIEELQKQIMVLQQFKSK